MRRLLLTSSQVSLFLSSIIALTFTLLLFLSGLFIQRRTVASLRVSLAPHLPPIPAAHFQPPPTPSAPPRHAPPSYNEDVAARSYLRQQRQVDWSRLAHVQVPTTHHSVCSAVMLFADLHRLKSPAKRVLLFPAEWLGSEGNKGTNGADGMDKVRADVSDPWLATTRRLLRAAGRRYGVQLRPVAGRGLGKGTGWFGFGDAEFVDEARELERRKLAVLMGLNDFDRVLMVRTPGWVLDATGLDAALAYAGVDDVATKQGGNGTDAVLVRTDGEMAKRLQQEPRGEVAVLDDARYGLSVIETEELDSYSKTGLNVEALVSTQEDVRLLAAIGELHGSMADQEFNSTQFLTGTSYITFEDAKLPAGPEYDIAFAHKVRARPLNKDADWVWTKLYGNFAERRREVCGLDLEWLPAS